ncbi:MAG: hypothetical protein HQM08_13360, partial [Candidatus Riflebacteria bacterium]|nr:hypothetical protein [Candidatus Riflebacteria bacterium]
VFDTGLAMSEARGARQGVLVGDGNIYRLSKIVWNDYQPCLAGFGRFAEGRAMICLWQLLRAPGNNGASGEVM